MAWQKTFLDKNRRWWLRKIARAQYYASATGKWYEGRFTEKSMSGNTMTGYLPRSIILMSCLIRFMQAVTHS